MDNEFTCESLAGWEFRDIMALAWAQQIPAVRWQKLLQWVADPTTFDITLPKVSGRASPSRSSSITALPAAGSGHTQEARIEQYSTSHGYVMFRV